MKRLSILLLLSVVCFGCDVPAGDHLPAVQPLVAIQSADVADTGKFVIDTANVIDAATEDSLNQQLHGLEHKNGSQVKVLTIQSTNGEDIVAYAQRTAVGWKLGQKGVNNGVLIVLAVKDRKIRVQTGYGMEEKLPDSYSGTLSRDTAKAYFKGGNYAQGLSHIANELVVKLSR